MLIAYQQATRLLLNDAGFATFNDFDLATYISSARGQIAGAEECIRIYASLAVTAAAQQYPFSAIALPAGTVGVQGAINVRMETYQVPGTVGNLMVTPREWEYFNTFVLSNAAPPAGPPDTWAQFGQGVNGTIFVNLLDANYTLNLDTVCYPVVLTTDATPEAIPYLWTDAVPYYAAYLAMLSAQSVEAAAGMYKMYELFAQRARQYATPSVLPHQYAGGPDPVMASRLGLTAGKAA